MPNQRQRKKKDGVNKAKKVRAMREKESMAKPSLKLTATGKRVNQTSKLDRISDRPGGLKRA